MLLDNKDLVFVGLDLIEETIKQVELSKKRMKQLKIDKIICGLRKEATRV